MPAQMEMPLKPFPGNRVVVECDSLDGSPSKMLTCRSGPRTAGINASVTRHRRKLPPYAPRDSNPAQSAWLLTLAIRSSAQPGQLKLVPKQTSMGARAAPRARRRTRRASACLGTTGKRLGLGLQYKELCVLQERRIRAAHEQQGQEERARDARGATVPRRRVPQALAARQRRRRRSSRTPSRSRHARSAARRRLCVNERAHGARPLVK